MSGPQLVPEAEAVLLEYPGYVQDMSAVMQTLGGSDVLAAAVAGSDGVIQMRFRPDDPTCHPIYGERHNTNGLLLRISRQAAGPGHADISAEVVARVRSKFTFSGMADYQYLPLDPSASGTASCTSAGPYGEESQPLLVLPPLFTKTDMPLDYAFKQFKASDKSANRAKPYPSWIIPYTVQQVPARSQDPPTLQGVDQAQRSLQENLYAQLEARLVWTEAAIAQTLPEGTQADLDSEMTRYCYQFREGPWKGAWIRHGHDPRTDSSSWRYQTLHYELPAEWYAKLSDQNQGQQDAAPQSKQPAAPSFSDVQRFDALPSGQTTTMQLCDLSSPGLQQILGAAVVQEACNAKTGWLAPESWQQIVEAVSAGFSRHL